MKIKLTYLSTPSQVAHYFDKVVSPNPYAMSLDDLIEGILIMGYWDE